LSYKLLEIFHANDFSIFILLYWWLMLPIHIHIWTIFFSPEMEQIENSTTKSLFPKKLFYNPKKHFLEWSQIDENWEGKGGWPVAGPGTYPLSLWWLIGTFICNFTTILKARCPPDQLLPSMSMQTKNSCRYIGRRFDVVVESIVHTHLLCSPLLITFPLYNECKHSTSKPVGTY